MLALLLLIADAEPRTATLRIIAERIASSYPASEPAPPPPPLPLKQVFPGQSGEWRRAAQGFYSVQLLPLLLGKKAAAYSECGTAEAAVARYRLGEREQHALVVRTRSSEGALCLFELEQQSDIDFACDDTLIGKQRKGVTTLILGRDYIKVRGHDDDLGGGVPAQDLACALGRRLR